MDVIRYINASIGYQKQDFCLQQCAHFICHHWSTFHHFNPSLSLEAESCGLREWVPTPSNLKWANWDQVIYFPDSSLQSCPGLALSLWPWAERQISLILTKAKIITQFCMFWFHVLSIVVSVTFLMNGTHKFFYEWKIGMVKFILPSLLNILAFVHF